MVDVVVMDGNNITYPNIISVSTVTILAFIGIKMTSAAFANTKFVGAVWCTRKGVCGTIAASAFIKTPAAVVVIVVIGVKVSI